MSQNLASRPFRQLPAIEYEDVTIRNREEDLSMSHNLTRRSFPNLPAVHYEDATILMLPCPKRTVQLSILACRMIALLQFVVGFAFLNEFSFK